MSYRDDLDAFLVRKAADRETEQLAVQFQDTQRRRRRRALVIAMACAAALASATAVAAARWPVATVEPKPKVWRGIQVHVKDAPCRDAIPQAGNDPQYARPPCGPM